MIGVPDKPFSKLSALNLNIPNTLTALRVLLTAATFGLLLNDDRVGLPEPAVFFILAWITDGLDGYFARKLHQTTLAGALFDLCADRFLTTPILILTIVLGYWQGVSNLWPFGYWPYVMVACGADCALLIGIICFILKHNHLNLPFPSPTWIVRVTYFSQLATLLIAILKCGPILMTVFMYVSLLFTLLAFYSYAKKGGYVIIAK
jgi:phosphatidylglycerophosphate synthase